jgi:hypothetical protein
MLKDIFSGSTSCSTTPSQYPNEWLKKKHRPFIFDFVNEKEHT